MEIVMDIRYINPFSHAYGRMKSALLHPFDISKWFVVGFTAFLSGLADCNGANGTGRGDLMSGQDDFERALYMPKHAWEWLQENPTWMLVIAIAFVFIVILVIIGAWLSARGAFMFLDNVVHDRAEVKKPWHEFRREGWSLFLWRLAVGTIGFVIVMGYMVYCYLAILNIYERKEDILALIGPGLLMVLGLIIIGLLLQFLELLVSDFIVQIMYRSQLTVLAAWSRFVPLLGENFLRFVGYGFFVLGMRILVGLGVLLAGLLTCCIGFLIIIIPYIGSVVLLPVSYTFRAFSVEYLEQFGPEYHLFPRPEPPPDDPGVLRFS
jgi:hypothetical protein